MRGTPPPCGQPGSTSWPSADGHPARAMAARLGVADIRFDWRSAIARLRPDIVSIATPGAAHCDIATFSASTGCHVVCDKPLVDHPWYVRLLHRRREDESWQEITPAVPDGSSAVSAADPVEDGWNRLFAEFVADIDGRGYSGYPTFDDGCVANHVIDQVRERRPEDGAPPPIRGREVRSGRKVWSSGCRSGSKSPQWSKSLLRTSRRCATGVSGRERFPGLLDAAALSRRTFSRRPSTRVSAAS